MRDLKLGRSDFVCISARRGYDTLFECVPLTLGGKETDWAGGHS